MNIFAITVLAAQLLAPSQPTLDQELEAGKPLVIVSISGSAGSLSGYVF